MSDYLSESVYLSVRCIVEKRLIGSEMPFMVVGRLGPRMRQVDRGGDTPQEEAIWGKCGASHCNQCMENLLRRCVKVREATELPFKVVSGVDPGIVTYLYSMRTAAILKNR